MKIRAITMGVLLVCGITLISFSSCGIAHSSKENKEAMTNINSYNNPQGIKEMISRMKSELEVDNDRFPDLIKELETTIAQTPDGTDKAVLHSMTAEMYNRYFQLNRWQIGQRTALSGYEPDDIREWTQNLFEEKTKEHLNFSLQPAKPLQQTPVSYYEAILEKGESSTALRPTLYDFLAQRAITIQPSEDIYKEWLTFRKGEDNKKALLMVELDYLRYRYNSDRSEKARTTYQQALNELMKQYGAYDFSNEIRIAHVNLLDNYNIQNQNQDSIQAVRYNILQEGIRLYPDYKQTAILKNKLAQLETPFLQTQLPQTGYPGKEMEFTVSYRNVKEITLRIYESLRKAIDLTPYQNSTEKKQGKLIREITYKLETPNTYTSKDTTLRIPANELGLYEYIITAPEKDIRNEHTVSISQLAAVSRDAVGKKEVLVTNQETGKPLQGAMVTFYGGQRRELKILGEVTTDKDGIAILPANKINETLAFQATMAGDISSRFAMLYPEYSADNPEQTNIQISLFTDRGLYRPGQTLFFKGIVYQLTANQPKVVPNKTYTVILRDANYKEISTQKLKTNEYGSFNGEFVLPKQTLTGSFSLSVENTSSYFQVEEYKRPTFAVEIEPIKEEIAFGDMVNIHGKVQTFSGVSLQEGKVDWRIIRRPFLLRMGYGSFNEEQVANGTTTVSKEGGFAISFRPEKTTETYFPRQYYNYAIIATVTDNKGESQETEFTFPVGDTSITLSVDIPAKVDKTTAKATVYAQLLNGEKTNTKGHYRIVSLETKDAKAVNPEYTEGNQVASGEFVSGTPLPSDLFKNLPSGIYRIRLEAKDSKGREVKNEQDFILYGKEDKRPPVFTREWLIEGKTSCLPGETAEWTYGTSFEETYVLYEIFTNNRLVQRQRIVLSNENKSFKLPFKEEYGDGVTASFTFVKEGRLYVTQVAITRKQPDRKLTIRPETFRDRLLPGNKETWKFRITDADSLIVPAEILAGLYDMSLDKIVPFSWYFAPERNIYLQSPRFIMGDGFDKTYKYSSTRFESGKAEGYSFDQLDWQGVLQAGQNPKYFSTRAAGAPDMRMKTDMEMEVAEDNAGGYAPLAESVVTGSVANLQVIDQAEVKAQGPEINTPLRTNFNETAFFFPSLQTNKEGDVIVSFTLPESTTTWKLQMIAHTKDLKYGLESKEVISSKPLMVLPNLPRYLRQGDKVTISTQVLSQSEKEITGKVRLEWFDPSTDQAITNLGNDIKNIRLSARGQTAVQWSVTVPSGRELIGCRIVADTDAGSDGEQHILPVLSNQIMITESTPFYLLNEGEQKIEIRQPRNSQPFRMTMEVSGNPVWYAVQALPTLTTPTDDNILSWFASYYGNTLATSIAQANPRIQKVVAQWASQGGDATTLLSNLDKNEELKNILLEETPWVLEAQNETEQKQRLSLLFDMNRANSQREAAMRQLLDQQKEDGGWGWFKGFNPDRNTTLSILKGMTQLVQLSATQYNQEEKEMQMRALRYLDQSIQKDYEALKKWNKDWEKEVPSAQQIEFLYVRSAYRDIPELGEAREAIRFYTNQAEKNWDKLTLYGKAQTALLMHRNGKKEVAAQIMAWLRKTATVSEEQGMYWANNRRGTDYFTSPIDVHTLLMSAFQEISPEKSETDRMKQWLLNQKRTQDWESVPATLNAIHAILLKGSDWLSENNRITIQWAGNMYDSSKGETATGYLKETLTGKAITSEAHTLTASKQGEAPAWGAIYNQYFTSIDQVTAQKGVLNVEKKLFIETNNGKERQIRPIANQSFKTGDKVIVRLTIRTDRDMDYVFLKDLRSGAFEPTGQLSGSSYQDGVWFYHAPKDVSENFYFQHLPKGTFIVEYPVYVSRNGEYAEGISTIQCLYAPEFVSHTEGGRITVKD